MSRLTEINPVFVNTIPDVLEFGNIYISLEFKTLSHLCACGCGEECVLPLSAGSWQLLNNNGIISLSPSIGNWSYQRPNYHAHYFITNNKIIWK